MLRVCLGILLLTRCHGNEASTRNCEKVVFYFRRFLAISCVAKKVKKNTHLVSTTHEASFMVRTSCKNFVMIG